MDEAVMRCGGTERTDVLDEEQDEDVVLVLTGVYAAA
jgi:hypothetical protein